MRLLDPSELPPDAAAAVMGLLEADGEHPENWTTRYVWESDRGYAVVMRWEEEVRAFTVALRGDHFEAWDVTE